ncbi:MAG: hypothetical protein JWQ21_1874 [Herminiimonas sp.]|nr:hypothetical protein [Herminiimonas sp.]
MKMTEQKILDLLTREGQPELDLNYNQLAQLFAHELAAISHKINSDELATLVVVGVALYQKGFKEFRAGIDEKALFTTLQKRRNESVA